MGSLLKKWSPIKTRRLLQLILVLIFGSLSVRSLLQITDHQSLLDDLAKDDVLCALSFEDDQLLVNPDDWSVIRSQIDTFVADGAGLDLKSANTGLFYDREEHELRVFMIRDLVIREHDDLLEVIDGTEYLIQRTPEALFGSDLLLVSGGSGVLEDALGMVRGYARGEVTIEAYDKLHSALSTSSFLHVLIHRYDIDVRNAARILLERFHPDKTLYVNEMSWITMAKDIKDIEGIVFDTNITTIPSFDCLDLENSDGTRIRLSELTIPSSVRRIASQAFPSDVFDIHTMRLNCLNGLYMEEGSLDGVNSIVYGIPLFKDASTIDFSDEVGFEIGTGGEVTFGFDNLTPYIHQYGLNGYTLKREKNIMVLYLYTNDFLIGCARNTYLTTYYVREGDLHPYHVRISHLNTFAEIESPMPVYGGTFLGWFREGDMMEEGDELAFKSTTVYGTWLDHS